MIDTDDLEPVRPVVKPLDLQQMSMGELKNYITSLEAEIVRAKTMIEQKEKHRSGLDGLFKTG